MVLNDAKLMITFIARHNATTVKFYGHLCYDIIANIMQRRYKKDVESEQGKPLFRSESIPFHCNAMSVDETDLRRL